MIKGKRRYDVAFNEEHAKTRDYFSVHFSHVLERSAAEKLAIPSLSNENHRINLPNRGNEFYESPNVMASTNESKIRFSKYIVKGIESAQTACVSSCNVHPQHQISELGINQKLLANFEEINGGMMTDSQLSLFNVISKYTDLSADRSPVDLMPLYCLHALDHVIRTRNMIIGNNQNLQKLREKGELTEEVIESSRDQGLARPKVLILCPMKKDAYRVIELFRKLIFGGSEKPFVSNYSRFKTEFADSGFRISEKRNVSDDYRELMSGNVDDCLRIGIGIAKKCLKLYTPFDDSDIIVASPLGLRMIVGEPDDKKRETDFLASIEILVIDKMDVLLMQNWEHLLELIDSLHQRPSNVSIDISRVRHWSIEQLGKYYRQTIMISSMHLAECDALLYTKCFNYAGRVVLYSRKKGSIHDLEIPVVQELQRIVVESAVDQSDARFTYFKDYILGSCQVGTLIFISSYFDFVRVRNFLKNEDESFVQLHEYAKEAKVAKVRSLFLQKTRKIMLITERFHFFRRYNIKGIKSIVFYQLPSNPNFYTELINMIDNEEGAAHARVIYTKFDHIRVANVFGDEFGRRIMTSEKTKQLIIGKSDQ